MVQWIHGKKRIGTANKRNYDKVPEPPYWPGLPESNEKPTQEPVSENGDDQKAAVQVQTGGPSPIPVVEQIVEDSHASTSSSIRKRSRKRRRTATLNTTWNENDLDFGKKDSVHHEDLPEDLQAGEGIDSLPQEQQQPLEYPQHPVPSETTAVASQEDKQVECHDDLQLVPQPPNKEQGEEGAKLLSPGTNDVQHQNTGSVSESLAEALTRLPPAIDAVGLHRTIHQLTEITAAMAPFQSFLRQIVQNQDTRNNTKRSSTATEAADAIPAPKEDPFVHVHDKLLSALDKREDFMNSLQLEQIQRLNQQVDDLRMQYQSEHTLLQAEKNKVKLLESALEEERSVWANKVQNLEMHLKQHEVDAEQQRKAYELSRLGHLQKVNEAMEEMEHLRKENEKIAAQMQRLQNENDRMRKMLSKTVGPEPGAVDNTAGEYRAHKKKKRWLLTRSSPQQAQVSSFDSPVKEGKFDNIEALKEKNTRASAGSPFSLSSASSTRAVTSRARRRIVPGSTIGKGTKMANDPTTGRTVTIHDVVPKFSNYASFDSLHRVGNKPR